MPAKGFELKHFLHPWPLHRAPASRRLIRVLSWSLFIGREQENSRQATQESAGGRTRTTAEKVGRTQGGVEAEANLEGP